MTVSELLAFLRLVLQAAGRRAVSWASRVKGWLPPTGWLALGLGGLVLATWAMSCANAPWGSEGAGFQVKCTALDCAAHFVIPRGQARAWPRSSAGAGLRCKRCGRFTARTAARCPRCRQWFVVDTSLQSYTGVCLACAPPPPGAVPARPRPAGP